MNTGNAFSFLLFAATMGSLPALAPGWFPPTGLDGSNGRAIWLEFMALVQAGCGISFLVSHWFMPVLARAMAYLPERKPVDGALVPAASQVRAG